MGPYQDSIFLLSTLICQLLWKFPAHGLELPSSLKTSPYQKEVILLRGAGEATLEKRAGSQWSSDERVQKPLLSWLALPFTFHDPYEIKLRLDYSWTICLYIFFLFLLFSSFPYSFLLSAFFQWILFMHTHSHTHKYIRSWF